MGEHWIGKSYDWSTIVYFQLMGVLEVHKFSSLLPKKLIFGKVTLVCVLEKTVS